MKALSITQNPNSPLVIHDGSGKTLTVVPAQVNNYKALEAAAKAGFYYPTIAIKQLKALAQGPNGKKYIYIPNAYGAKTNSMQVLNVYLPGIMATVERRPNDTYALTYMELSEGYKLVSKAADKPGVYRVETDGSKTIVTQKKNGQITLEDNRTVVICDGGYSGAAYAAQDATLRLKSMSGEQAALRGSFDILYSPLGKGLGKASYNPLENTDAFSSAVLLANAMKGASKRKGVYWVSQYGGSNFLTLAMRELKNQNIELSSHIARLYRPTSSIEDAREAANKIGIKTGNNFAISPYHKGQRELMFANLKRAINKDDEYNIKNFSNDLTKNILTTNQIIGLPLYAASLTSITGALGIASTVVGGIGATHLLWTLGKNHRDKPNFK